MDPTKLLNDRLQLGLQTEKTFSDRLKERRNFVQGQENTALPIFERLLEAPGGEARIASSDVINPLRGLTTENTRRIQEAESGLQNVTNSNNSLLNQLISLSESQKDRSLKERELALKESGGSNLSDLLKVRQTLSDQGLDTSSVDAELQKMGVGKTTELSKEMQDMVGIVDQLLNSNTKPITGTLQLEAMIPGTKAQNTVNLYNQLISKLSLDNRKALKGSGQISDFEAKMLEKAASSLGRNLSDDDFRKNLEDLKSGLIGDSSKSGGSKLSKEDEDLINKYKK